MLNKILTLGAICALSTSFGAINAAKANQLKIVLQAKVDINCKANIRASQQAGALDVTRSCNTPHKIEIAHPAKRDFKGAKGLKIQFEGKEYKVNPGGRVSIISGPVSEKSDTLKVIKSSETHSDNLQFQITPL